MIVREHVDEPGDDILLELARSGDRDALDRLLARHQARIYRFGMKMCRQPEDAEDVLQDTLLAAARSIRDFRGGASLSTWLYTIARSFCIKQRRKSKFAPKEQQSLEHATDETRNLIDPGSTPDEAALDSEARAVLDAAIRELEPEQREVLLLRDVEGLRATEVARVLGISVPAVKSRLHRARLSVRRRVAPELGIPLEAPPPSAAACPDVLRLYSRHVEGEVSAELCTEMERHLAGCARCTALCDSLKHTLALCSRLEAEPIPDRVQRSVRRALRDAFAADA